MTTPADVAVIPRDIHFRTDSARGTAWLGGDPVATAVFNALSLTFPEGERLFIDSVRAFRLRLPRKLADEVRAFIAQEAIHSREHANLNAGLDRGHYPVERIETSVRRRLASSVVNESVTVDELVRKCGEPTSRRSEEQDVRVRTPNDLNSNTKKVGTTVTEYWTYDRGGQAPPVLVTIRDGKVRSIQVVR
jgi:hypothetical protein